MVSGLIHIRVSVTVSGIGKGLHDSTAVGGGGGGIRNSSVSVGAVGQGFVSRVSGGIRVSSVSSTGVGQGSSSRVGGIGDGCSDQGRGSSVGGQWGRVAH